ncbi:DUF418 domain-containing protein [Mucilaginibacter flavidus]|uniref:DUF418 domain-containing protein n=1 Tax=Mucilaginibacter flavidus TaxID=2949309 RepID=UPI002092AB8D|nr:DUF418 domain-containing protein [Mucilaginibacter flavidus]MCO5945535.1 DUF418 domain-containing protein [Mucilaginibacter flavidus]
MPQPDFKPIEANKRLPLIDILRGWALLGVVVMNYGEFYFIGLSPHHQSSKATDLLITIANAMFSSKSWTLLSFLFGYGFSVIMQNTRLKNVNSNSFFIKRMLWLFLLAFIDSAFFFGDILKDYAFLGLILLLFSRCSAKKSLYISAALFLVTPVINGIVVSLAGNLDIGILSPYLPLYKSHSLLNVLWFGLIGTWKGQVTDLNLGVTIHTVMFCCFLIGQATQKSGFFNKIEINKSFIKKTWLVSLILILTDSTLVLTVKKVADMQDYLNLGYWWVMVAMTFTATSICLLYMSGKVKMIFSGLQAMGKMTLTNYMVQNFVSIILFSGFGFGFGLTHRLPAPYYYLLGLLVFILQIFISKWWLRKFYYGPVEWVWRQLSYGKRLPGRIK